MNEDLNDKVNRLETELNDLKALFFKDNFSNQQIFRKDVEMARKISLNGQVGFFGEAPVGQQGSITTPSGGATQDTEARTAIVQIKTALDNLGITA
jgi:hypothetical protein